MKCQHARKLFAAFWDDETTQAEREWLESHFSACTSCRIEYEAYARTVELIGSLPRLEPAPGLAERALQRARRTESAPDRLPVTRTPWVPVTAAAAAVLLIALTLVGPWFGAMRGQRVAAQRPAASTAITEPVLVQLPGGAAATSVSGPVHEAVAQQIAQGTPLPDSLFDHSEDVEFVLDPVVLHRGRASVTRAAGAAQGERAVVTF